jgi:hypothetical protein
LNKQYLKEEYEKLVPKIIDHMRKTEEWGDYLQPQVSTMGYNETIAQEQFPLREADVSARGWQWYIDQDRKDSYFGPEPTLPQTITEVPDTICDQILRCAETGKPFKIIPQELKFYRQMGLPLPTLCPDQRHSDRIALRSPRRLWKRKCQKCQKEIETTYQPDRPEIVYCEECYLASVY